MQNKLKKAIYLFNNRNFFEAHEIWEQLWKETIDEKKFLKGLIFIAGGYYHYLNNNIDGAVLFLEKGLNNISQYNEGYMNISLKKFKKEIQGSIKKIKANLKLDFPKIKLNLD